MTSDTYLPRLGGGEYHVYYVIQGLQKLGHEVTLITSEPASSVERDPQWIVRVKGNKASTLRILWILWHAIRKADLVHAHYNYRLAFYTMIVAWIQRKPSVMTQHGLGLLPQLKTSILNSIVFRVWRRVGMMLVTRIISTSEDLSLTIRELGFGSKIVSIPNGFDSEKFQPQPMEVGSPRLLTVRRLVPKNGVQYLIQIVPILLRIFPDVHIDIVGEGRLRAMLESKVQMLGIDRAVTFHGALKHEHIIDHYKRATVVLFPSTAESTSLACIEAMALSRVVIASRVGGLIELLGHDEARGYLASLTDSEHSDYNAPLELTEERAEAFAKKVISVLSDLHAAWSKAQAASQYAFQHYRWETIVEKTVRAVYMPLVDHESL